MRYVFLCSGLLLFAALLPISGGMHVPSAYACSAGEDFDPVAESEVIVGGWVSGWRERPDIPSPLNQGPKASGDYRSLGVVIAVDQVFKGPRLATIEIVDSYIMVGDRWIGTSCAVFDRDPTGWYATLGLMRGEDGEYHSVSLKTFFLGEAPAGERYEYAMRHLISPPVTGSGGLVIAP